MRKIFLLISFFILTPTLLIASIIFFGFHEYSINRDLGFLPFPLGISHVSLNYAALPTAATQFEGGVDAQDARIEKVKLFYKNYNAPLEAYAEEIVSAADKNGLDWRILPAISMQESGGGKKMRANCINGWGWGQTAKKNACFANFSEAIESITRQFAHNYVGQGLDTIESIGQKYNPTNTNEWSDKVKGFMTQLDTIL